MKKKECRAGERCAQLKIKDSIYDGSKTYGQRPGDIVTKLLGKRVLDLNANR